MLFYLTPGLSVSTPGGCARKRVGRGRDAEGLLSLQATDTVLVGSELGFSAISREPKLVANQNGSQNEGLLLGAGR